MRTQNLFTAGIAFVLMLVMATSAMALELTIDRVELDDHELSANAVNRLDVERDKNVEVEVTFTPTEDLKNVEIMALISGYEYNSDSRIVDVTPLFDADKDVKYRKTLSLALPDDVDEDNYRLRIMVTDRDGEHLVQDFSLKLDVPRHELKVRDVVLFPGSTVTGGDLALATVRLENKGEKDEEDVKVAVYVPELKLSATDFIEEVESEEEVETEELLLRVPKCAEAGSYAWKVVATYDEGRRTVSKDGSLTVLRNSACDEPKQPAVVVQQPQPQEPAEPAAPVASNKLRRALEVVLVGLLVLLVIVGLIIGFAKLSSDDE